jgi:hypothetical protein
MSSDQARVGLHKVLSQCLTSKLWQPFLKTQLRRQWYLSMRGKVIRAARVEFK